MTKKLNQIISWGIAALAFSLPLFFLPITTDFYTFNKNFLLIFGVLGLLGLWGIKGILGKKVVFTHTPLDLPVLLLAAASLASTLLASPNRIESLLAPGGTGTILGLTLLYFLVTNNAKHETRDTGHEKHVTCYMLHVTCLTASAVTLAVVAIWQFLGVGESLDLAPWLAAKTWTPAGGLIPLASFLGVIFLGNLGNLGNLGKQAKVTPQFLAKIAALVVIFGGLGVTVYQLAVTNKPLLLPYSTGWAIALETFKNYPFLGSGPSQFLTAFTRFRPLGFNSTNLWALRFTASSNYYFNLLTEVGVVGLAAFLWLVWKVLQNRHFDQKVILISIFILLAFLPANFLLLLLFYLLLAGYAINLPGAQKLKISLVALREGLVAVEKTELEKYMGDVSREREGKIEILPWLIFIPTVILILGSFYFLGRVYAAELDYKKALEAAIQNKGKETYDLQIAAITKNPYFDYYRISYSQINLALANSIASNPNLTDQDRATITQLIEQAIREGKAAVTLNRLKVQNWENLAVLYRSLINFAEGADQWTTAAYTQAINLDPFNPGLRIDLGGVWYTLGNWELAQRQFEMAVNLKPDLANAHYNLATALREKKDQVEWAQQELQTTLDLLEPGSADYEKVKAELEALKEGLKNEEEIKGEGLEEITPPEAPPTGIKPPLELGEEAGPALPESAGRPEVTITPEAEPTATPTPTVKP